MTAIKSPVCPSSGLGDQIGSLRLDAACVRRGEERAIVRAVAVHDHQAVAAGFALLDEDGLQVCNLVVLSLAIPDCG